MAAAASARASRAKGLVDGRQASQYADQAARLLRLGDRARHFGRAIEPFERDDPRRPFINMISRRLKSLGNFDFDEQSPRQSVTPPH